MKKTGFWDEVKQRHEERVYREKAIKGGLLFNEEYRKFKLNTDKRKKIKDLPLKMPEKCFICGNRIIKGYFDYKVEEKDSISIPLCSHHYKNVAQKARFFTNKTDIFLFLGIVITFLLFYLSTLYFSLFEPLIDIFFILVVIFAGKKTFEFVRYNRTSLKIRKNLKIKREDDSVIIRIKADKCTEEFEDLSMWHEVPYSSKKTIIFHKKAFKWALVFMGWLLAIIPLVIIVGIYFPNLWEVSLFLYLIVLFLFIGLFLYYLMQEQIQESLGWEI